MPSKKKKYNARFPAGRIKKIMQTDEEIGKVAQAVPVIISRTLELFVESLLKRAMQITSAKNAKTLTPTHMKQCILSESRFDFLKDLVKGIPDVSSTDDEFGIPSGIISPGAPVSARVYGGYGCFQFHQSPDSGSSKSSGATSHSSAPQISQPKFYKEIPISSENCENRSCENVTPSIGTSCGTTFMHHTGSQLSSNCLPSPPNSKGEGNASFLRTISGHNVPQLNELKLSNCNKPNNGEKRSREEENMEEEEEGDDEDKEEESRLEENGYHKDANIAESCAVDEDYDT